MEINRIIQGDALEIIKTLPDNSVNCIVTSPPYYGLRDYGTGEWIGGDKECGHKIGNEYSANKSSLEGSKRNCGNSLSGYKTACSKCGAIRQDKQIGLEETPEEYIAKLVEVFRELRRILRDDGTCWLNLGDSYASSGGHSSYGKLSIITNSEQQNARNFQPGKAPPNLKPKNLIGIPWRVAFALQADGWWLRSDIIWHKKNCMPSSVTDRPTTSHEYIFLLTKNARYWYDQDAIREENSDSGGAKRRERWRARQRQEGELRPTYGYPGENQQQRVGANHSLGRNKRTVWSIATQLYKEAHFAVFPQKLVEPCILAGCPSRVCVGCGKPWERVIEKTITGKRHWCPKDINPDRNDNHDSSRLHNQYFDYVTKTTGFIPKCQCNASHHPGVVLDPFMGAGTVAVVAIQHGRDWLGIELNPDYIKLAEKRINQTQPSLPGVY